MKTNNRWECQLSNSILFSGGRSFRLRVHSGPSRSLYLTKRNEHHTYITRSVMASHDTKKTVNNVYTLCLLTKEVGELTQHIGETT